MGRRHPKRRGLRAARAPEKGSKTLARGMGEAGRNSVTQARKELAGEPPFP